MLFWQANRIVFPFSMFGPDTELVKQVKLVIVSCPPPPISSGLRWPDTNCQHVRAKYRIGRAKKPVRSGARCPKSRRPSPREPEPGGPLFRSTQVPCGTVYVRSGDVLDC